MVGKNTGGYLDDRQGSTPGELSSAPGDRTLENCRGYPQGCDLLFCVLKSKLTECGLHSVAEQENSELTPSNSGSSMDNGDGMNDDNSGIRQHY